MNNYWDTNYRAGQGGHFTFHYEVTSAPSTQAADLSRMGWEAITPLEADTVTPQDKALTPAASPAASGAAQASAVAAAQKFSMSLDGKQQSFLDVEDANVLLETWKPAEDGNGTILRFLDFGGTERTVTVRIPSLHLVSVIRTDAVERGQTAVPLAAPDQFSFTIHPHEIVTLRLVEGSK
jgi:alpha-mannosidase